MVESYVLRIRDFVICSQQTSTEYRSLRIDPRFNTGIILFSLPEGLFEPWNRPSWKSIDPLRNHERENFCSHATVMSDRHDVSLDVSAISLPCVMADPRRGRLKSNFWCLQRTNTQSILLSCSFLAYSEHTHSFFSLCGAQVMLVRHFNHLSKKRGKKKKEKKRKKEKTRASRLQGCILNAQSLQHAAFPA